MRIKNILKYGASIVAGLVISPLVVLAAYAISQGGTNNTSFVTNALTYFDGTKITSATVGTGLTFSGGTLSATGGGGSGTVGTGTIGQFPYYAANGNTLTATSSLFLTPDGSIGVGTTTPFGIFSVDTTNLPANMIDFAVGSSTKTALAVQASGVVTLNTNTPSAAGTELTVAAVATNQVGIFVNGLTSGIGFETSATTGNGFLDTALSSGNGLDTTITTTGNGVLFNTTQPAMTTATGLAVIGTANMTADYTGELGADIEPLRNVAAAATRLTSGNMLKVMPTFSTTGALKSINDVTGTTTNLGQIEDNVSTGAGSAVLVTAPQLAVSNSVIHNANIFNSAPVFSVFQNATSSATGTVMTLSNSGLGNLATFVGNGFFGIGTTSPYRLLSIAGDEVITGNSYWPSLATPAGTFLAADASGKLIATTTPSGGGSSASSTLLSDSNTFSGTFNAFLNNVGIGTIAPANPLEVVSGNSTGGIQIRRNGSSGTAVIGFRTSSTESATNFATIGATRTDAINSGDSDLVFSTQGSNVLNERLRITSAGNVGIGSSSPEAPLTIANSAAVNTVFYRPSSLNVANELRNLSGSIFYGLSSTAGFAIANTASLGGNALFIVQSNGNTGIGSTTPSQLLSVGGNAYISGVATSSGYSVTTGAAPVQNGFYSATGNNLLLNANGVTTFTVSNVGTIAFAHSMTASGLFTGTNAHAWALNTGATSATAPSFSPDRADTTTGIGADASGDVSIINGGVETARFTAATTTFMGTGGINLTNGCLTYNGGPCVGSGSTSAGGLNTQVQYNNSGAFGGVSGMTTNGTNTTFAGGSLILAGASTGTASLQYASTALSGGTFTFPGINSTQTVAVLGLAQTFTGDTTFSSINGNFGSSVVSSTYQLGYGATISGQTKTLNIGTGGVSGSATAINIGSAFGTTVTFNNLGSGLLKTTSGVLGLATADTDYQAPITLTTTGTSGAATFSGHTLNIPQYAAGYSPIGTTGQFPYFSASNTLTATSTLFLASSGNVGIGTSSPSSALNLYGTSGLTIDDSGSNIPFVMLSNGNTTGRQARLELNTGSTALNVFSGATGAARNNIQFFGGDANVSSVMTMTILGSSGNVGIGSSTPGATLSVNAAAQSNAYFDIGSSTGDVFKVAPSAAPTLGIGTTSPWQTLSIVGGVAINGLASAGSGNDTVCINPVTFQLAIGGSGTNCSVSSERYKNTIATSTVGIQELMQLRPVTFYYNNANTGGDSQQQLGFIAEEAYKIDPRLVQLGTDGKPQSLKLDNFISLIAKSVQDVSNHQSEQDQEIAEMHQQIVELQNEVASSTPQSICMYEISQ